jgi:hypothetical protein
MERKKLNELLPCDKLYFTVISKRTLGEIHETKVVRLNEDFLNIEGGESLSRTDETQCEKGELFFATTNREVEEFNAEKAKELLLECAKAITLLDT